MSRILIVEDEPALASALSTGLTTAEFVVDVANDGEKAWADFRARHYDLVLLDLMLPRLPGMDLLKLIRGKSAVPVLVLTARDTTKDIVSGLDAGANDYLTKPFAFAELLARVRALLRAAQGAESRVIKVGTLQVDTTAKRVTGNGVDIRLAAKEYQILEYLVAHREQTISKTRLRDAIWSGDHEFDPNLIEVYVGNIRRKIEAATGCRVIHTMRGFGYVVREPAPAEPPKVPGPTPEASSNRA